MQFQQTGSVLCKGKSTGRPHESEDDVRHIEERSDLTPCDYLWGYVKEAVYVPPLPITLDDLRNCITAVMHSAVDELFKLIQLFVVKFQDSTEQEIHEINTFKKQTLQLYLQALHTLHVMYHEATACHVSGDMLELLSILLDFMKCLRVYRENKDVRGVLLGSKEWVDVLRKLATLLNTYNSSEMRTACIGLYFCSTTQ
ncbi:hypothetical protein C0J52_11723 [Blattella germanica]|nr:hypothetical protein C0J52_11723 [Blattella germanica]